jgi:hypothetical protein
MKNSMHRIATLATRLASAAQAPAKLRLAACISALGLFLGAQQMSASTTYIVGTCTSGTQFSTIQAALDASPAPNTVEVCPAQYAEQLTITNPVTIEGITASNGSLAQIVEPTGGFATNATIDFLGTLMPAIAQVYVNNVSGGAVNLTNLDIYGVGSSSVAPNVDFIGIVYVGSSGTINQVTTHVENPPAGDGGGLGMWIQGGSSKPSVTVENSSIHDFSDEGIVVIGNGESVNATIKNNMINSDVNPTLTFDITLEEGANATITGNFIGGGGAGVFVGGDVTKGSVTSNTIFGSQYGIELDSDGISVKSNNIYGTALAGIYVDEGINLEASVVENNTVKMVKAAASTGDQGIGIELNCNSINSSHVNSNTIMDAFDGYNDAPSGFSGSNTYVGLFFNVNPCSSDAVSRKARAAAPLKPLARGARQKMCTAQ